MGWEIMQIFRRFKFELNAKLIKSRFKKINIYNIRGVRQLKMRTRLCGLFALLLIFTISTVDAIVYIKSEASIHSKILMYSDEILNRININANQSLSNEENFANQIIGSKDMVSNLVKCIEYNDYDYDRAILSQDIVKSLNNFAFTNKNIDGITFVFDENASIGTSNTKIDANDQNISKSINNAAKNGNGKYVWMSELDTTGKTSSIMDLMLLKSIKDPASNNIIGSIFIQYNIRELTNIFQNVNLSNNSNIFIINSNGKLVASNNEINKEYLSKNFIQNILNNNKNKTTNKVFTYKIANKNMTINYKPISGTDLVVISSIPNSDFIQELNFMQIFVVIIALICIILSMFIVIAISNSITIPITKFIQTVNKMKSGDLTSQTEDIMKDEIGDLFTNFNSMRNNTNILIKNVRTLSNNVYESTRKINHLTEQSGLSCKQVAADVDGIAQGAQKQFEATEKCDKSMQDLADLINAATGRIMEASEKIEGTREVTEEAMVSINFLNNKSEEENQYTKEIIKEISVLSNDMNKIREITSIILDISNRTNLLSLNAAIEAANAGQEGKGFSVVADEVRKLANQSKDASNKINNIINDIKVKTDDTVAEAKQATKIVNEQVQAVNDTNEIFKSISASMAGVNDKISQTRSSVDNIINIKNDTLNLIENISVISEKTTSVTQKVAVATQKQIANVDDLIGLVKLLDELAEKLSEAVQSFKIS